MRRRAFKIMSYLRAGYLLHVITFLELSFSYCLFSFADIPAWLVNGRFFLKMIALSPIVIMPLFAQLDARSRYQEYKLVKDHLYIHGFQKRILNRFIKSRCQRDAIKTAAMELGMAALYREYSKSFGYKWYHLFPDAVFERPLILLTKNFWETTLFTKTYNPKIDFEKVELEKVDKSLVIR